MNTNLIYKSWPIDKLIEYANNPRVNDHAVDKIAEAIKFFGFRIPIVAKSDGTVVDGHLRLKAARQLGMTKVPVVLADDLTDEQIRGFRISVNKMSELADWDEDLLRAELLDLQGIEFDMDLLGFDLEELEDYLVIEPERDDSQDDEVPEPPAIPVSKPGDVWLLGKHRLMCSDSTSIDAVNKLMNGQKADMVFTDPPYGMKLNADYSGMESKFKNSTGGNKYGDVIGDHEDFYPDLINSIFSSFPNSKEVFLWGADYYAELLKNRNDGSWIVWDKRGDNSADKMFGSTFELCWSKSKHKRDTARIKWAGIFGMEKEHDKKRVHPTQKPVLLVEWFFQQWGEIGDIVTDPFGGSGSTLIACEKTGRICYMMEISPAYIDVIITRWQTYTDQQAIHEATGQTFDACQQVASSLDEAIAKSGDKTGAR